MSKQLRYLLVIVSLASVSIFTSGQAMSALPFFSSSDDEVPSLAPMLEDATPAVVSIAVEGTQTSRQQVPEMFRYFFGAPNEQVQERPFRGLGSGVLIDAEKGYLNIKNLVEMAAKHDMFVRLDMEDHRVTQDTIDVVVNLHNEGLKNVGTVYQGRLFRTLDDIDYLEQKLGAAADYRICKGIYLEPEEIAHTGYSEIVSATNASIDKMLAAGAYCAVASHDKPVIDHALSALKSYGMGPGIKDPRENSGQPRNGKGPGYEFQMLLGVRGPLRRKLAAQGHRTRVYIPYGEKWYEYSIRRLKENPTVGAQVAKAFLMPWTNRP